MLSRKLFNSLFTLFLIANITACSFKKRDSAPRGTVDVSGIQDPIPKDEPLSRYGNPRSYKVFGKTYYLLKSRYNYKQRGIASWYGTQFHGERTSSGETYSMYEMTAAHKTLPIPTYVEVTNLRNGKKIIVRVNDRGPFHANRIIDLSYVAAKKLGIASTGTGMVEVRSIDPRNWPPQDAQVTVQRVNSRQNIPVNAKLFVQAGAFSSKYNAQALEQQLSELLPSSIVRLVHNKSDGLYRVRVGPISGVKNADNIAQKITENGFPSPHVVIE